MAPTELAGQLTAAALRPSSTPGPPSNKMDGRGTRDVLCGAGERGTQGRVIARFGADGWHWRTWGKGLMEKTGPI